MSAVSNIFLTIIDFFLSPKNLVSAQERMRARIVVFILLFWAFVDANAALSALFSGQPEAWAPGLFIFVDLIFALLIKKSFAPAKVYIVYSILFLIIQLLVAAFKENLEPLSFLTFITFIYINCLINTDLKVRLAVMAIILVADSIAFLIIYNSNSEQLLNFPADPKIRLIHITVSTICHLAVFPMVMKIKNIAQAELHLEVVWQERAKRLEDSLTTSKAMGKLLASPIKAVQKDLEQLKKDPSPFAMDDLQKQLNELLSISTAVNWIYRTQRGEDSLSTPSPQQVEVIEEMLVKIKASRLMS